MKKGSLSEKGLSLSQASSLTNLCNQRCLDIEAQLTSLNNCSKTINYENNILTSMNAVPMPTDIVEILSEKAKLHACQAFLMENIKLKDNLLKEKAKEKYVNTFEAPVYPKLEQPATENQVDEKWGWEQLTVAEHSEFLEKEAFASHIGQFIHKGSVLDKLRKELPTIKPLEWITPPGDNAKAMPVIIKIHNKSEELLALHEKFALIHREHEQRVNFFKAKVKTSVTLENARIAKANANNIAEAFKKNNVLLAEYKVAVENYNAKVTEATQIFEAARQENIKTIAAYRISVDPRFQMAIDLFKLAEE